MIVTTTPGIEGKPIREYLWVVTGEAVNEIQQQARDLDQRQQALGEQLAEMNGEKPKDPAAGADPGTGEQQKADAASAELVGS